MLKSSALACLAIGLFAIVLPAGEDAQGTLTVRVRNGPAPVPAADVSIGGLTVRTDVKGEARLTLPAGERELLVKREGFEPAPLHVTVLPGQETVTIVQLHERGLEETVTVVSATRSSTMVEDQAIRVEALPQEEIEENSTVAPGNLTTLLEEIGGLRVQNVSPALGGANFRVQGLGGRYTQILIDELPLYGEVPDAFNLLQIPPLDLAQVEVIKGAASALVRLGKGFRLRLSAGTGSAVPTPFLDETDAVGFSRVLPLRDLEPERAQSESLDLGWSGGHFELGETLFVSMVAHALLLRPVTGEQDRAALCGARHKASEDRQAYRQGQDEG